MRTLALAIVMSGFVMGGVAEAFHEEGAANCSGCHLTHPGEGATEEWAGMPTDDGLLKAESPSDVCLLCHADSLGVVLGPDPLAPPRERGPGNFVFLLEENLNDAAGGAQDPILGDAAGHNLAAPGHGLTPDTRYARAPGGHFPSDRLGCTSCHDPHGNTSFRMLHGAGPVMEGVATFAYPAPTAVGTDLTSGPEGRRHHTAYLRGVSAWCANCHGRYHEAGSGSAFEHPIDESLGAGVSQRYNEYDGDGNPAGGLASMAYLPEVPFEDEGQTPRSADGPSPRSRIMCLSCHRAHGSSAPAAGRWDFNVSLLVDDGVESGSYALPNPYSRADQGPLCLKCHGSLSAPGDPWPLEEPGAPPPPPSWPTGSDPRIPPD